ncbi:MAG: SsrA-binding protein SmpB [Candidatus Cloacimonetes bacterium]|jgi:SsrA-binding protein|nr:SsrA-binding protein SmpB [Candidatus Cloacimonadota bacterium]
MRVFKNRKARHNYFFIQELEAGIVLKGSEIKSIREGKLSFKDSYANIEAGEIWLYSLHISPYKYDSVFAPDPERKRKLLLNKREIKKIKNQIEEKGMTLIPAEIYINDKGLAKIKIALAKGKRQYDKREDIKKKDIMRDMQRNMKLD